MATLREIISAIIEKQIEIAQNSPISYRDESGKVRFVGWVNTEDGRKILLDPEAEMNIVVAADHLFDYDSLMPRDLRKKMTKDEWRDIVRKSFGPALGIVKLKDASIDQNADAVLAKLRDVLAKKLENYGDRELSFGCSLFADINIKPFSVGPVNFESKFAWAERKSKEGAITGAIYVNLIRKWDVRMFERLPEQHMPDMEKDQFRRIQETISACNFVCSVKSSGLGDDSAKRKSLTAARLAFAAISLLYEAPSSALNSMGLLFDNAEDHLESFLIFPIPIETGKFGWSSGFAKIPGGESMEKANWERYLSEAAFLFNIVGDILNYVVYSNPAVSREKMINALTMSLLWFYKGCREENDLVAIVNLSAALDALANGGRAAGIKKMLAARLEFTQDTFWTHGNKKIFQAINVIYGEGRSKTIHGNNLKFRDDWSDARAQAESLARIALFACFKWVAKNPKCDDPEDLSK